jgi:ankyrin repeat protein
LDIVVKNNNYHALVALLPPQTAITHITSINKNEFNLFYQTVFYGQTLMVNYFVNTLKIDINLQNPISGETALHYAVKGQQTEMIDLLIKNGANLAITDNNKESPQITSSTLPLSPTTPMPLKKPTILKEKSPLITFSTFSPSPTIPKALKKALIDGDVQKYIDKKLTTIEELITLQNENPWIISALRCLNIREGIYNNFITVADLAKLSEEQVASIKHTFSKEELKSQVDNFQEKNTPF